MKQIYTIRLFLLSLFFAMASAAVAQTTVTDVIDYTFYNTENSGTYREFTSAPQNSGAEYNGKIGMQQIGTANPILLSYSNSVECGIVSTQAGEGTISKVTISWHDYTTKNRQLIIYGKKDIAYSSYKDLYESSISKTGDELSTIEYTKNSQEDVITIPGGYKYIGFKPSGTSVYINSISVEWSNTTFLFPSESVTVTMGEETNNMPILQNGYTEGTVKYASSNTAVATVDESNGRVALVAAGETAITASYFPSESSEATRTASYKLIVKESPDESAIYYKVRSESELVAGCKYIFTGISGGSLKIMGCQGTTNRMAIDALSDAKATVSDDKLTITGLQVLESASPSESDKTKKAAEFTLSTLEFTKGDGRTYCYFQDVADNSYLVKDNTKAGTGLNMNKDRLITSLATITIDDDGNATFAFDGNDNTDNDYTTKKYMRLYVGSGSGNSYFYCPTNSTGGDPVQIYRRYDSGIMSTFRISSVGYSTFWSESAIIMPYGLQGGIVTMSDGSLKVDYRYKAGDVVPAGTGLLLKGAEGQYVCCKKTFADGDDKPAAPEGNLLRGGNDTRYGNDGDNETRYTYVAPKTSGNMVKYYVLSMDKNGQNLGFYYGAKDGEEMVYQNGRAFLAIEYDASSSANIHSFLSFYEGDETGISDIFAHGGVNADGCAHNTADGQMPASPYAGRIYTLTGQYVGASSAILEPGIYIKDGRKIVVNR